MKIITYYFLLIFIIFIDYILAFHQNKQQNLSIDNDNYKLNPKNKNLLFSSNNHTIAISSSCLDFLIPNCANEFYLFNDDGKTKLSTNTLLPALFDYSYVSSPPDYQGNFDIFFVGGYGYDLQENVYLYHAKYIDSTHKIEISNSKINVGYSDSSVEIIPPSMLIIYGGHTDILMTNELLLYNIKTSNVTTLAPYNNTDLSKRKGHSLTYINKEYPFIAQEIKNETFYPILVLFGKNQTDYTRLMNVILLKTNETHIIPTLNKTFSVNDLIRGYIYPEPREGHKTIYSREMNSIFVFGGCNYRINKCFNRVIYRFRLYDLFWEKFPFSNYMKSSSIVLVGNQFIYENWNGNINRFELNETVQKEENKIDRPRKYKWKNVKKEKNVDELFQIIINQNESAIDEIAQKMLFDIENNYLGKYKEITNILEQIRDMKRDKIEALTLKIKEEEIKYKKCLNKSEMLNMTNHTNMSSLNPKGNKSEKVTTLKDDNKDKNNTVQELNETEHFSKHFENNEQFHNITINQKNNTNEKNETVLKEQNGKYQQMNVSNSNIHENKGGPLPVKIVKTQEKNSTYDKNETTISPNPLIQNQTKMNTSTKEKLNMHNSTQNNIATTNSTHNSTIEKKNTTTNNIQNNTIISPSKNKTQLNHTSTNQTKVNITDSAPLKNVTPVIEEKSPKIISTPPQTTLKPTTDSQIKVKKIENPILQIPLGHSSKTRLKQYSFLQTELKESKNPKKPTGKTNEFNFIPIILGISGIAILSIIYIFSFSKTEKNCLFD